MSDDPTDSVKELKKPVGRRYEASILPEPLHYVTMNKHKATTLKHGRRVPV